MKISVRTSMVLLVAVLLVAPPRVADAGLTDLFHRAATWWSSKSLRAVVVKAEVPADDGAPDSGEAPGDSGDEGSADEGTQGGGGGAPAGMCLVPQNPPVTRCEIGSGFLCVDTPPGSVAGDAVVLRGTIDRQTSVLASIRIASQSDYTKRMAIVDTKDPDASNCWDEVRQGRPFCLDADGRFSARVPLGDKGPSTILASATRFSGEAVERSVRVSSVIAPTLTAEKISFDPDVRTTPTVDAAHVAVTVKLLGECQFCDFIGAGTGGVTVSVENVIRSPGGGERRASCATTIEQGGQGQFIVGVPAGAGENRLTVRACNAAADGERCAAVSGITFTGTGAAAGVLGLENLTPPPSPTYDADAYPTIPWRFRLGGDRACLTMRFNREAARELCPDGEGVYSAELLPAPGINVASLAHEEGLEEVAWTFGWGRVMSPHASGDGSLSIPSALELAIPASTVQGILLPFLNHFLASDERQDLLAAALRPKAEEGEAEAAATPDDGIAALIPKCSVDANAQSLTTALRGEPSIGKVALEGLTFDAKRMGLAVALEDLSLGLDLTTKAGLPPLPLVIGIRKASLDLALASDVASDGKPLLLLTSAHDDCEFKAGSYCQHKPAALVPSKLVGNATPWGSFIRCDVDKAQGEARKACAAINALNAQTGVVSEKVLDAINGALYCGVSASLTRLARGGMAFSPIAIGCREGEACAGASAVLPRVAIPWAVNLAAGLGITKEGLFIDAGAGFGSAEMYAGTPEAARIPAAGIIAGRGDGARALSGPGVLGDLGVALSLDALNALLFAATAQGDGRAQRGLLDLDIHERFLNAQGFDFVKACDEFLPSGGVTEPPTLCHLRPRVGELLGSALTSYGYFPGNRPLLLAIRGNRALGLRVAVATTDDVPVVARGGGEESAAKASEAGASVPKGELLAVDIGGLGLSFYALEVDAAIPADRYGNVVSKFDAQGRPVIHSMRPEDPDPLSGPIVRFDLTLLAALEIGAPEPDPKDATRLLLPLSILADRSRLVLTPVPGSNATTVPPTSLGAALDEKLKLGLSAFAPKGEGAAMKIPLPRAIAFAPDEDGSFAALGLSRIEIGKDGLALTFDPEADKVRLVLSAILTQVLHQGGEEMSFTMP